MASHFIPLVLFLIHKSSSQPITYTDLSCNDTYPAQVPANFTQYFRFSVPTDTTNAIQIDLCNSNFDTVVEIYKYKTDNVDDYLDSTDNYIAKNDDWDQSSKYGCPFNTSSIASYYQLSPFTYANVANYTGYYIIKLYDLSNQDSNDITPEEYTLKFTCNPITTKIAVDGVLNCNQKKSANLAANQWNLIQINAPPSFAKANYTFNPGFTLDSCNTNFYANYKLLSSDLSEPCCLNYNGDSMCNTHQSSNGGEYLTFTKSNSNNVKWYYLNVSSQYNPGRYDLEYLCEIIPTASPTKAPTLIGGSVACGETISGSIHNSETYSYSFDIPSYANNSKSISFVDCNSNENNEISMNVQRPDGNSVSSSWYTDFSGYCGTHNNVAVLQFNPDMQYNNRTDWSLQVTGSSAVIYNITYVCQDITPSPTPVNWTYTTTPYTTPGYNYTFPYNISANITDCGQELTGVLVSYYNDTPALFGFNLNYWNTNMFMNGPFVINPCDTQYPLDVHILSLTNLKNQDYSHYELNFSEMAQCDNGYNYILSWQPDDIVYGSEYLIGWTGKNGSKNQAIYDQSDGSYDVTFECPIMTPSPISDYNFSFALNITANITQCNQQLLGELNTYYNDSDGMYYRFYRLDLDYWIKNNLLNGQNTYPFIIDPCDTQYPLDIKIGSYTNIKALKNDTLLPTTAISKCKNGYNYKLYWSPNATKYGTEYLVAWAGTNKSSDRDIFINTDRSYDVNFMCSTITMSPSAKPSRVPTLPGYTYPPSKTPTPQGYTYGPSTKPSRGPTLPGYTYPPSKAPTPQGYTYGPSKSPTRNSGNANGDKGSNKSGLDAIPSYVWLILVIILAILFVVFLFLWCRKKKQMDAITEEMGTPYVQLTDETDNRKL